MTITKKSVATYARVSTSNQEDQKTIETQIMAMKDYLKDKEYAIVKEYQDEGWSGDSIARPGLDQLRLDAKKNIWKAVVIYDPDRLARRYSYQELVTDELREAGIEVIFVTTPTPKDGIEKLLHGVQGIFAEYERVKITERFRMGRMRLAREGHIVLSRPAYGYTLITKKGKKGDVNFKQGHYIINKPEATIVKRIFSWIANEGYTLRKVVSELQKLGIKPQRSKRGVWQITTIGKIIKNRTYIGEAHFGASYAVVPLNPRSTTGYRRIKKTTKKFRPESEWIKIAVPAIIEKSLFEKAHKRLKDNFTESKRNRKNSYLLTHRLFCTCGYRRSGAAMASGRYTYYMCQSSLIRYPLPASCKEKLVRTELLDKVVWTKIKELLTNPEIILEKFEEIQSDQSSLLIKNASDAATNRKEEVARLDALKEKYLNAYTVGALNLEELSSYNDKIQSQKQSLLIEIAATEVDSLLHRPIIKPQIETVREYANKALEVLPKLSHEETEKIIKAIVVKVVVGEGQVIIYGRLPDLGIVRSPLPILLTPSRYSGLSTHSSNGVDTIRAKTDADGRLVFSTGGINDNDTNQKVQQFLNFSESNFEIICEI